MPMKANANIPTPTRAKMPVPPENKFPRKLNHDVPAVVTAVKVQSSYHRAPGQRPSVRCWVIHHEESRFACFLSAAIVSARAIATISSQRRRTSARLDSRRPQRVSTARTDTKGLCGMHATRPRRSGAVAGCAVEGVEFSVLLALPLTVDRRRIVFLAIRRLAQWRGLLLLLCRAHSRPET